MLTAESNVQHQLFYY